MTMTTTSAAASPTVQPTAGRLTHLQRLEAEAIQIMREAVSESERPAMLYSIGKDSSVMLHLAMKAFYPSKPPFPLVHVDTTFKFQDMYAFRDNLAKELGLDLIVHQNPECIEKGINPFDHGSAVHTDMWKTEGLKQVIDANRFDLCFGGARRDEEKSRAKERIFSIRTAQHQWDPKRQRPELWQVYNARRSKRRDGAGVPDLELDRARRLAVRPPRADPDRAALLRGAPSGGRSRRHADHGRRRSAAAG
jgi:sulfate adenylyltransferase subunit 2